MKQGDEKRVGGKKKTTTMTGSFELTWVFLFSPSHALGHIFDYLL
jgi:hypothetical protein